MRIIKIILLLIIIALIATFIFQNQAVFAQKFELGLDLKLYKIGPYLAMNFAIILVSFLAGGPHKQFQCCLFIISGVCVTIQNTCHTYTHTPREFFP